MKKYIFFLLITGLTIFSCKKKDVTIVSGFDVTTDKASYKAGDTVRFRFSGNPNYITFYSGEPGNIYSNVKRTTATGTVTMSFSSQLLQGSTSPTIQQNTLKVLYSTSLVTIQPNFVVDSNVIMKAPAGTFTDITSRFTLPLVPGNSFIPSGTADITDIASTGKTVFFLFQYKDVADPVNLQRQWTINSLNITNTLADGTKFNELTYNSTLTNPVFTSVNVKNPDQRWVISGPQITINGAKTLVRGVPPAPNTFIYPPNVPDNEDYVVTGPYNLFSVNPDYSVAVKGFSDVVPDQYLKTYKTPGTYVATFVGKNQNIYNENDVVKTITITVNP